MDGRRAVTAHFLGLAHGERAARHRSQGTYSLDTLKGWLERLLRLDVVAVDVCGGLSPAQGAKPQDLRVNGETDVELQEWILTCLER